MKFTIVGTGGTGGTIGAYLAQAGNDVTFIARGKHLEAIREKGLTVHTEHRGDILIRPAQAASMDDCHGMPPDVMFVCVKYYSLEDAIAFAKRTAGPDTLIIPILNVFGTGEVMQQQLPGLTCLDGCMYIVAKIQEPGVIVQPNEMAISYKAVDDLEKIGKYEPNVVKAAWNIFGKSYLYRQKYNEYKAKRMAEEEMIPGQMSIFDLMGGQT